MTYIDFMPLNACVHDYWIIIAKIFEHIQLLTEMHSLSDFSCQIITPDFNLKNTHN